MYYQQNTILEGNLRIFWPKLILKENIGTIVIFVQKKITSMIINLRDIVVNQSITKGFRILVVQKMSGCYFYFQAVIVIKTYSRRQFKDMLDNIQLHTNCAKEAKGLLTPHWLY